MSRVAIRTGKRDFSVTPSDWTPFMSGVVGSTDYTGHTDRTGPKCSDFPRSCIAICGDGQKQVTNRTEHCISQKQNLAKFNNMTIN